MIKITGAYIEVTEYCNEHCPYCYNEGLMKVSNGISYAKMKDLVYQFLNMGVSTITLSGGEPFLHPEIHDILRYIKSIGINTTIISNGYCFEPNSIDLLIEQSSTIQLTFDGFDPKTHDATRGSGNFNKLINGYRLSIQKGFAGKIVIRVNLYKGNIRYLGNILDMIDKVFFSDINTYVSGISLSFLHKASVDDNRFDGYIEPSEYGNQLKMTDHINAWNASHEIKIHDITNEPDIGCPFYGITENVECGVRVAINGDVFPCQLFSAERFCIGNIYRSSLQEIVSGEKAEAFLNQIRSRRDSIAQCKRCAFQGVCGSGCPGQAFTLYGTLDAITDRCAERKKKLAQVLNTLYVNRQFLPDDSV